MTDVAAERPELTVTEAAKATGVDRRTIRRRLDADEFPNAHRDDGKQGPGSGPWLIPVEDLLGAGLKLHAPTPPDEPKPAAEPDEVEALRVEVAHLKERLADKDQIIEVQNIALRALQAGPVSSSPATVPTPVAQPSGPEAAPQPRRRWWQRSSS
jgi:hypothetical protein